MILFVSSIYTKNRIFLDRIVAASLEKVQVRGKKESRISSIKAELPEH